ncbi:hypothetical protein [Actinomycetospora flava]|uniref:DUF304 domain-containing protein n=1 Tax=Actinomycetospora flava TaxID=3129232 RepID=A0ABU8LXK1_9PSEU
MGTDGSAVVLRTAHVTVRARVAVIEIRQHGGSSDDWTAGCALAVGVVGAVVLVSAPLSVATWVFAPVVVLLGVVGAGMLVQRVLTPGVHLDCVAWTAAGSGLPWRRSFGGAPVVHTAVARDRYRSSDVVLSAGNRSTVVVGRIPRAEAEEVARALRRLVRERDLSS